MMKKIVALSIALFTLTTLSFAQQKEVKPSTPGVTYGKSINQNNAISTEALQNKLLRSDTFTGKIKGEVTQVCKMSGCYLMLGLVGDNAITVRFKEGAFTVPADLNGKTVILEGKVTKKSADSINMIADGILVIK
ncbi:DUF4920 domain-containing protein [Sphingobacterium tabacisoli]|uniref:DUF4920 domain-containing protein n=1 Tax=Sphingobacterium tabacisoli TaxID=2044855 RepID=A0ABW5KXP0_9SPHI|nr:DUF4920 domain-containing protein [Sphingobacterium tabacisoli]